MACVIDRDWYAWHQDYDDPDSALARRLAAVQDQIQAALDVAPRVCDWFAGRGFEQVWVSDPAERWGVAAHRFAGTPVPLERGARMFTFTR